MSESLLLRDEERKNAWAAFTTTYGSGAVVRGMVNKVRSYGITVRIVPGVVGFVPIEEIGPFAMDDPERLLWPDDIVEAIVTEIDSSRKRVKLSIKQLVSQRVGLIGSAVSPAERERFSETAGFSEPFRQATCPDVSEWPLSRILEQVYRQGSLAEKLNGSLQAICQETGSVAAAVFRLDPVTETVTIVAQVGISSSNSSDVYRDLRFSPLEEIWQGKTVLANMVRHPGKVKFHGLLRLLDFDGLMGIPIVVAGRTNHGLVVFAKGVEYQQQDLLAAIVASIAIGSTLEKGCVEQHQRFRECLVTLGRLSAAVFHEVRSRLALADFSLDNLWYDIRRSTSAEGLTLDRAILNERVERVAESIQAARELASQYMELWKMEARLVEVGPILETVARMLAPLADYKRVRLELELAAGVPQLLGDKSLFEQACLNVAMYAIEQATHNHQCMVTVRTSFSGEGSSPIEVRFVDNGPGIHRKAWDQVFELGYTTRVHDTGIGLYLARNTVESLGGRLFVEDSIMFLGTTYLMQLPAAPASGQGEYDA